MAFALRASDGSPDRHSALEDDPPYVNCRRDVRGRIRFQISLKACRCRRRKDGSMSLNRLHKRMALIALAAGLMLPISFARADDNPNRGAGSQGINSNNATNTGAD